MTSNPMPFVVFLETPSHELDRGGSRTGQRTTRPGTVQSVQCLLFLANVVLIRANISVVLQSLFDHIPVGVGSKGVIPTSGE